MLSRLELKNILELTRDPDGSTLSSLNEGFKSYLELNKKAEIVQVGPSRLQVEGDITGIPRAIPIYLHKNKVNISLWETIKSIVAHKSIAIGYVPIELVNDLKGSFIEVKFMRYDEVYGYYESQMMKFLSLPKEKQLSSRLPNVYLIKE